MSESILEEAQRLIHGQRNKDYGHPRDNITHTAELFSAYLGIEVSALDVTMLMVLLKMSRLHIGGVYHRDSIVDIAGYAGVAERVYEEPVESPPKEEISPFRAEVTREWDSLDSVPHDVTVVSQGGCQWKFWQPGETNEAGNVVSNVGEWLWSSASGGKFDKTGPFTEVLARHDQKENA